MSALPSPRTRTGGHLLAAQALVAQQQESRLLDRVQEARLSRTLVAVDAAAESSSSSPPSSASVLAQPAAHPVLGVSPAPPSPEQQESAARRHNLTAWPPLPSRQHSGRVAVSQHRPGGSSPNSSSETLPPGDSATSSETLPPGDSATSSETLPAAATGDGATAKTSDAKSECLRADLAAALADDAVSALRAASDQLHSVSVNGQGILHLAAAARACNCMIYLVSELGISPRTPDALGRLPLHIYLAALGKEAGESPAQLDQLMMLLSLSGSRRVMQNGGGCALTPLHVAAQSCQSAKAVQALLRQLPNPASLLKDRDGHGRTAFELGCAHGVCPQVVVDIGRAALGVQSLAPGCVDDKTFAHYAALARQRRNDAVLECLYRARYPHAAVVVAVDCPDSVVSASLSACLAMLFEQQRHGQQPGAVLLDTDVFFAVGLPALCTCADFAALLTRKASKMLKRNITQRKQIRKRLLWILHTWLAACGPDLSAHAAKSLPPGVAALLKTTAAELDLRPSTRGTHGVFSVCLHNSSSSLSGTLTLSSSSASSTASFPSMTSSEPWHDVLQLQRFGPRDIAVHLSLWSRQLFDVLYPEALVRFARLSDFAFAGERQHLGALLDIEALEENLSGWALGSLLTCTDVSALLQLLAWFCAIAVHCHDLGNYFVFDCLARSLDHPTLRQICAAVAERSIAPPYDADMAAVRRAAQHIASLDAYRQYLRSRAARPHHHQQQQQQQQQNSAINHDSCVVPALHYLKLGVANIARARRFVADESRDAGDRQLNLPLCTQVYNYLRSEHLAFHSRHQNVEFVLVPETHAFLVDRLSCFRRLDDFDLRANCDRLLSVIAKLPSEQLRRQSFFIDRVALFAPIGAGLDPAFERDVDYAFRALFAWKNSLRRGAAKLHAAEGFKATAMFVHRVAAAWRACHGAARPVNWTAVFRCHLLTSKALIGDGDLWWMSRLFHDIHAACTGPRDTSSAALPRGCPPYYACQQCPAACQCSGAEQASKGRVCLQLDVLRSLCEHCAGHPSDVQNSLIGLPVSDTTLQFLHIAGPDDEVSDDLGFSRDQLCDLIVLWNKLQDLNTLKSQVASFSELICQTRSKWEAGALVVFHTNPADPTASFVFGRITAVHGNDVLVCCDASEEHGVFRLPRSRAIPLSSSLAELVKQGKEDAIRHLVRTQLDDIERDVLSLRTDRLAAVLAARGVDLAPLQPLQRDDGDDDDDGAGGNVPLTLYYHAKQTCDAFAALLDGAARGQLSAELAAIDACLRERVQSTPLRPAAVYAPTFFADSRRLTNTLRSAFAEAGLHEAHRFVASLPPRFDATLQRLLSGEAKNRLASWWHEKIKTRTVRFLVTHGYVADVVPPNYTDHPPANMAAVHEQLTLLRDILSPADVYKFRAFVWRLTGKIHTRIDAFVEQLRLVFAIVIDASVAHLPDQRVRQWIADQRAAPEPHPHATAVAELFEDYQYLVQMRNMDDALRAQPQDQPAAGPLKLTAVVPISGLIVGVVVRFATEVETVIELWG